MKPYTSKKPAKTMEELTPRQQSIVTAIVAGKKAREMAKEMRLSVFTVNAHIQAVFARTETNTKALLIRWFNGVHTQDPKTITLKTVEGCFVKVTPDQIIYAMRLIDQREVISYARILNAEKRQTANDQRKMEAKRYEQQRGIMASMLEVGEDVDDEA